MTPQKQTTFKGHYLSHYNSKPIVHRPRHNEADCSEAARRLSEPTYDKPGMRVAFYESARRA